MKQNSNTITTNLLDSNIQQQRYRPYLMNDKRMMLSSRISSNNRHRGNYSSAQRSSSSIRMATNTTTNLMAINQQQQQQFNQTNFVQNNNNKQPQQQQQQQIIRTNRQQRRQTQQMPTTTINTSSTGYQQRHLNRQTKFHVQNNLVNIFQTYCSEVKELKDFFEMKFAKLHSMETKINNLLQFIIDDDDDDDGSIDGNGEMNNDETIITDFDKDILDLDEHAQTITMNGDNQIYCIDNDDSMYNVTTFHRHNQKDQSTIIGINNHRKIINQNDNDDGEQNISNNNNMFEPIIDIQIKDDDDDDESNHQEQSIVSIIDNGSTIHSSTSHSTISTPVSVPITIKTIPYQKSDTNSLTILTSPTSSSLNQRQSMMVNNLEPSDSGENSTTTTTTTTRTTALSTPATTSSSSSRKITHNVHSKNEFMQMIERFKEEKTLIRERISSNVFMLRRSPDNSIVGYQCSIDDCTYMHFLRAQVNRHFKNFHSKTCYHCNQRFKKPYELSLHLKELEMDPNHVRYSQQLTSISSQAPSSSSSLLTSADETMENISGYETSDSIPIQPITTTTTTTERITEL
ncbi:hypothetical protein HUG17_3447 [Dermatophagoides farinae]|nr:putative uncharacterized protein DDB_G0282129 [Dermatophagoides farinae]KAH7639414.1 hypothetical protein HUG17_3447 [Dermatophagoides farinae]